MDMDNRARKYPKRTDPATIPEIGRRLRVLRKAVAGNITELGNQTGITRSAWSNYENAISRIGVDAAMKVCDQYGVTLDWIYRGDSGALSDDLKKRLQELEAEDPPAEERTEGTLDNEEAVVPVEAPAKHEDVDDGFDAIISEAKYRLAQSLKIRPSSIKIIIEA
jgi:transcriptional regulator with XRE-family HTH domain